MILYTDLFDWLKVSKIKFAFIYLFLPDIELLFDFWGHLIDFRILNIPEFEGFRIFIITPSSIHWIIYSFFSHRISFHLISYSIISVCLVVLRSHLIPLSLPYITPYFLKFISWNFELWLILLWFFSFALHFIFRGCLFLPPFSLLLTNSINCFV